MSNPYAKAAARVAAQTEAQTAGAVVATEGQTPQQTAQVVELARRTGAPVGAVRADPEGAQAHVERQQLAQLQTASPTVAAWVTEDPDRYALAKPDVALLPRFALPLPDWRSLASPTAVLQAPIYAAAFSAQQVVTDPVGALDVARAGAAAVPRDVVGRTVGGFGQLWNLGERMLDRTVGAGLRALGVPDFDRNKIPRWLRPGDSLIDTGEAAKGIGEAIAPDAEGIGIDIASAVGQLSGQVVQGIVAPQTLVPSLFAQGADIMGERAQDAGTAGTFDADAAIIAGGSVTALAERLGIGRILQRLPAGVRDQFSRRVVDIAAAGGTEAATEVVEGVAQDVLTRALVDEDFEIAEGIEREAIAAGSAGAILRAVVQGVAGRRSRLQAQAEQQHVDSLVEVGEASTLKRTAPEVLAELVEAAQPDKAVFLPLEALRSHYGSRTEAAVATLTGSPDAYAEAVASGAEVQIPLGRYVAAVSQADHAALRDTIRLQPDEVKPNADPFDGEAAVREAMALAREVDASTIGEAPVQTDAADPVTPADAMDADSYAQYLAARQAAEEQRKALAQAERGREAELAAERRRRREWQETARQVEAEIAQQPVYRAARLLRTGRNPDGSFAQYKFKLDEDNVATFGPAVVERLKGMTAKRGGLLVEDAAVLLGYENGARMLHDLATMPPIADAVRAETDARMAAEDVDTEPGIVDDGTDAEAKALEAELHGLERRAGGIRTHLSVLRETARRIIANKEAAAIRPALYRLAVAKAQREAVQAAIKRDWQALHRARRQQLQALLLQREAQAARDFTTKSGRRFAQLMRKQALQRIGKAGSDYQEQLVGLLGRFNLANLTEPQMRERESLRDWISSKAAQGVIVDVPPTIADEAFRMPFRRLKLGELRELRDAVETIVHAANTANLLRLDGDLIAREEVDHAMAESVAAHHRVRSHDSGDPTIRERVRGEALHARALTATATDIARELDGFTDSGAVWQNTIRVIREASNRADAEIRAAQEAHAQLRLKHYTKAEIRDWKRREYIPEVGAAWSKERIIALALNWGSDGNREAILEQVDRRLRPEQVGALLSRLDGRDWDYIEGVWRTIGRHWSDIAATQRRRTGLAPERVPPSPFVVTLPDGTQRAISGGYYPLKYESNTVKELRIAASEAYDAMRTGRYAKAATRRGHTIERVGSGGRVVRLDLGVIGQHEREVIRDLRLGDAVNYVHTALHGQQFAEAVNAADLAPLVNGLDVWLRDVATGEVGASRWWERGLRMLRTNFTASVLTYRVTSAALQVTGILQTSVVLGKGATVQGVKRYLRHPVQETRRVIQASEFMHQRLQTHVEAVQTVMNAEAGRLGEAHAAMIRWGYYMIGRVQATVDVASWIAAERVALERGDSEADARAFADDLVSRAQSSGSFIDKTAIQRGTLSEGMRQSELIRATTMLQSYMTAKWNAAYERTAKANLRSLRGGLSWSMDMVSLFVVEGMIAAIIRGQWPDDEDNDGLLDDVAAMAAEEGLSGVLGGLPGLSVAASELRGYDSKGVLADAFGAVARTWNQIEQGEADSALRKAGITLSGFLLGVPSSQLNKSLDAIEAAGDGHEVAPIEYLTGPADE